MRGGLRYPTGYNQCFSRMLMNICMTTACASDCITLLLCAMKLMYFRFLYAVECRIPDNSGHNESSITHASNDSTHLSCEQHDIVASRVDLLELRHVINAILQDDILVAQMDALPVHFHDLGTHVWALVCEPWVHLNKVV